MKRILALVLFAGLALAPVTHSQVPQMLSYQAKLNGNNVNGNKSFKFALVDPANKTLWSNNGSGLGQINNVPNASIPLQVNNGLMSVMLGDPSLMNSDNTPMQAISPTIFQQNSDVRLRIWLVENNQDSLVGEHRMASVAYAMMSAIAPGSIGPNEIAPNAINSSHIQNGIITGEDIAPNSITSAQLADKISLGPNGLTMTNSTTTVAKLYEGYTLGGDPIGGYFYLRDSAGGAGVILKGQGNANGGEMSVYSKDGDETVEIWGQTSDGGYFPTGGQVKIKRVDGQTAASLADGLAGGQLDLYSYEGNHAMSLYAWGDNTGGEIAVRDANGTETVEILGAGDNDTQGAQITMRQANGTQTIQLDAEAVTVGGGGYMALYKGDGTPTIILRADSSGSGRVTTQVLEITGGSDLSENFDVNADREALQPGMILCIDAQHPGKLIPSSKAYDRTVAGVISGAGGVNTGMLMGQSGSVANGKYPVALTGRVYCMVDASYGAIQPGDLITTSETLGHGMKVTDDSKAHGTVIGKAMSSLDAGKGLVLVLVSIH